MTEPIDPDEDLAVTSRRRFLRESGGALMGGAVLAGGLAGEALAANADNVPPNVPEWMKAPGDPVGSQFYGMPSPFEKDVVRNVPKNGAQYISAASRTPLQDLDGIITPNGLFYERHHGGIPAIDPAQHRLMLHGLVDKPMIFTVDDIRRFPSQSRIHFIECSGNLSYKKPFGKTASDLVGLLSCAEWTGVSLKLVLQEAGLPGRCEMDRCRGRRRGGVDPQHSDRKMSRRCNAGVQPERRAAAPATGLSTAAAAARLRRQHEREMVASSESRFRACLFAGGNVEIHRPDAGRHGAGIHFYMEAKSIVTRPSGGQKLGSPGFHEITGVAWSGHGKIKRVDVSVDGGKSWQEAQLQEPVLTRALTRFRLPWQWDGQPAVIQSRAIDEIDYVQPSLAELLAIRGENSFYHNNAIQPWRIDAQGQVTNANA